MTGWPPGLLQDDSRKLSDWFASRVDARWAVRQVCADIERKRTMTNDKTREDFEAWVTKQGHAAGYGGDGVYDVWVVSRWWESYQAATQQSAARIASLEAEVMALREANNTFANNAIAKDAP